MEASRPHTQHQCNCQYNMPCAIAAQLSRARWLQLTHQWVLLQCCCQCCCIGRLPLHPQRQCLDATQQQEGCSSNHTAWHVLQHMMRTKFPPASRKEMHGLDAAWSTDQHTSQMRKLPTQHTPAERTPLNQRHGHGAVWTLLLHAATCRTCMWVHTTTIMVGLAADLHKDTKHTQAVCLGSQESIGIFHT